MRYCRNFAKAGLKLSQYMVATQESINSRLCSVVEIKLSFFLKGGHLQGQAEYTLLPACRSSVRGV